MNRIAATAAVAVGVATVSAISYKLGKYNGINAMKVMIEKTINEFNEDLANKRSAHI